MSSRNNTNPPAYIAFIAGVVASLIGSLSVGILSADLQGNTPFSSAARAIFRTPLSEVSIEAEGKLCSQDGVHLVVSLNGFRPNEVVRIRYYYIPSEIYSDTIEETETDNNGSAVIRTYIGNYSDEKCPSSDTFSVDVSVYRRSVTKSTRQTIYYEIAVPTRET